jgi:hypothetical protein
MSKSADPSLQNLNDCGCCEGISVQTPVEIENNPGLKAIAYRVGTHAQFKQSMMARLSASEFSALKALSTREDDDFSIALLDAWATVADVITFYQESVVNESYLRTATERLSIQQLAHLIGYELSPGVAASTYLAFTLEKPPAVQNSTTAPETFSASLGIPSKTIIEKGTKVQSIPGPGEQAQVFETVEEIEARPELNTMRPRLTQPQNISLYMARIIAKGNTTNVKQGDKILIVTGDKDYERRLRNVISVKQDSKEQITYIELEKVMTTTKKVVSTGAVIGNIYPAMIDLIQKGIFIESSDSEDDFFKKKVALSSDIVKKILSKTWRA